MRTVSVDILVLHRGLFWENQYDNPKRAMSVRRTLGGGNNIQSLELSKGRQVILSTSDNLGNKAFFTRAEVEALKEYERLGGTVDFVYGTHAFSVIVVSGGVEVKPIGDPLTHSDDDKFLGTIKLLEV